MSLLAICCSWSLCCPAYTEDSTWRRRGKGREVEGRWRGRGEVGKWRARGRGRAKRMAIWAQHPGTHITTWSSEVMSRNIGRGWLGKSAYSGKKHPAHQSVFNCTGLPVSSPTTEEPEITHCRHKPGITGLSQNPAHAGMTNLLVPICSSTWG